MKILHILNKFYYTHSISHNCKTALFAIVIHPSAVHTSVSLLRLLAHIHFLSGSVFQLSGHLTKLGCRTRRFRRFISFFTLFQLSTPQCSHVLVFALINIVTAKWLKIYYVFVKSMVRCLYLKQCVLPAVWQKIVLISQFF